MKSTKSNMFFALRFSKSSEQALSDASSRLPLDEPTFVRSDIEMFHLTIRYLGPVREEQEPMLREHLRLVASSQAFPKKIVAKGLLLLPSVTAPRVVSAYVQPNRRLSAFATAFREQDLGTPDTDAVGEKRAFLPHVTIARVSSETQDAHPLSLRTHLDTLMAAKEAAFRLSLDVKDVALLRVCPNGPSAYEPVETFSP